MYIKKVHKRMKEVGDDQPLYTNSVSDSLPNIHFLTLAVPIKKEIKMVQRAGKCPLLSAISLAFFYSGSFPANSSCYQCSLG